KQAQQTRTAIANLPPGTQVDPAFLPTLETIEVALPSQLEAINELAKSGDWGIVRRRLDNELKPIETQTSVLVGSIQQQANGELTQAVSKMASVQRRILFIVPTTAISTFFIAAFFGWAITRRIVELRLEERVSERTRIARELHDTLLQSFQGLLLRFQSASNLLPTRPQDAKQRLDNAIDYAAKAITEGRDAVHHMRSTTLATNDLASDISMLASELGLDRNDGCAPEFSMQVEGRPQNLHPIVRDEVYRIAAEALRNAFKHSGARRIEVEIRYGERELRMRTRDDGRGIDPAIPAQDRPAGHWGLSGMRERANLLGGNLKVWSEVDSGTEVELIIPAAAAYTEREAWY